MGRSGQSHLVISLDFELMWGVRDHVSIAQYGANVRGVRNAVPRILDLFERLSFSNYGYLDEIGNSEKDDPYYFGFSLLKKIQSCTSQEIATHTFSHYYCLEQGQTPDQFKADLDAAIAAAGRLGIALRSIVFPRNQYGAQHLEIVGASGLRTFRGSERSWLYQPASA